MKVYRIIIFLFAISMFGAAMNAGGVFSMNVATQGLNASTSEIEEIISTNGATTSVESGGFFSDLWAGASGIARGVKFMWNSGWSVLGNFHAYLQAFGIPGYIADMFYGMLVLIIGYGILFMFMNRSEKQ